jgi:hypothetical protein
MIEPALVDHPVAFPQACVACMSQQGPLIDTHVEKPFGHVYVCAKCVKTFARLMGFAKGEKLNELEGAIMLLADRDRQIEKLGDTLRGTREELEVATNEAFQKSAELSRALGRIEQLESLRRSVAEELIA